MIKLYFLIYFLNHGVLVEYPLSNSTLYSAAKLKNPEHYTSNKKKKKSLSGDICVIVKKFYEDDDNSRILPSFNNNKCIKNNDGSKSFFQKRLVLYNLRELYLKFKEQNLEIKIGFSKFAELRPEYCILAGASGTHTVCVCVYHQNVKFILDGLNISEHTSGEIKNYKGCMNEIVYKVPTAQCYLNTCSNCPEVEPLKSRLLTLLENSNIYEITHKM